MLLSLCQMISPQLLFALCLHASVTIVAYAIDFPAYGQNRVSNELRKLGMFVSPSGVQSIWLWHNLNNSKLQNRE